MNYLKNILKVTLAIALLIPVNVFGRDKTNTSGKYLGFSSMPTDYEVFDVNRWNIDTANDGRLVVNNVRGIGGEWADTGVFLIYAQSWWFAGLDPENTLRVVGNEFSADMSVGPYQGDPNAASSRTYNVSKAMLADPISFPDFQEWPVDQGAPWVDVDGDGVYTPLPGGTDHPEFVGDQVMWSIQNDAIPTAKSISGGVPTNVEVRTTMFGFDRPDAFGDIVFFKHAVTNTQDYDITDAYFGVWVDPDNGVYDEDLIGVDPDLSLGYCYNDGVDAEWAATEYGPGPAVGYDFFQGPAVPCTQAEIAGGTCPGAKQFGEVLPGMKNLELSGYNLFINSDAVFGDPEEPDEFYYGLQGLKTDGTQLEEQITGATCTPEEVAAGTCTNPYVNCEGVANGDPCYSNFSFWGDPSIDTDFDGDGTVTAAELALNPIDGYVREPGDRRFLQSVGPFTLEAGATQEIVYGALAAYSTVSSLASIEVLKQVDALAQLAYDIDFALPDSPPSPVVDTFIERNGVTIYWSGEALAYSAESLVDLDENGAATSFAFEGFKVYQYSNPTGANAKVVATLDVQNGITDIVDTIFDPNYGANIDVPVANGTDSGASTEFRILRDYINNSSLLANREYYFGVSSYGYNEYGIPKMLESSPTVVSFRVEENQLMVYDDAFDGTVTTSKLAGAGGGSVSVELVDPSKVTGHDYQVSFDAALPTGEPIVNWSVTDVTTGEVVLENITVQDGVDFRTGATVGAKAVPVVDGFRLNIQGPAPGHKRMWEILSSDVDNYVDAPVSNVGVSYQSTDVEGIAPYAGGLTSNGSIIENRMGYVGAAASGVDTPYPCDGSGADVGCEEDKNWDWNHFDYMGSDDIIVDYGTPSIAWEYPYWYPGTTRANVKEVPFSIYRFTNDGRKEQLFVAWDDLDENDEWNLIDYDLVDANYATTTYFRNMEPDSEITKDEIAAFERAFEEQSVPWYDVVNGPSFSSDGWEPVYAMAYQSSPYDPSLEATYLQIDDIYYAGGCEHLHNYWYGAGCNMDVTLPVTAALNGVAHYGTYMTGWIWADYFGNGLVTDRAYVLANNKPNGPTDVFSFNTGDFMASKKAYNPDNITVWPNPYYGSNVEETGPYDQRVTFSNLPNEGETTVRIYAVDGTLVRLMKHNDTGSQHLTWDLNNEFGIPVASGMYFAHIDARNTEKIMKLAIVQPEMRIDTY